MMPHPVRDYLTMSTERDPDEVIDAEVEEDIDSPRWASVDYPALTNLDEGYTISTWGTVKSPKGAILKPNIQGRIQWVSMRRKDGSTTSARIDKMVLSTFAGFELLAPHYKDDNPFNCRLDNLFWGEPTSQERVAIMEAEKRRRGEAPPVARKRASNKKKAAAPAPKTKAPSGGKVARYAPQDEIQSYRVHQYGGITLKVGMDGGIISIEPHLDLSPEQAMKLGALMERVVEMNKLMGVK